MVSYQKRLTSEEKHFTFQSFEVLIFFSYNQFHSLTCQKSIQAKFCKEYDTAWIYFFRDSD